MINTLFIAILTIFNYSSGKNTIDQLQGAWQSDQGVIIFAGEYFSFTAFSPSEFNYTFGGSWKMDDNKLVCTYEYNTQNSEKVGSMEQLALQIHEKSITIQGMDYNRLDDGKPGALFGTWLFANRVTDGKLGTPREADNPRKTMKILSGTRFQWIAFNTETKEFMGTGGGTYSTSDGKYTENIDFFSRDNSRVGASLEFDYELNEDEWHHKGLSSKGDPIYEIWNLRK
jgi:hypothetical protein